jgi:hypothetical protein
METNSTVEITTYDVLGDGDVFVGTTRNSGAFLGMKVATKAHRDGEPNHDVMVLSSEKRPELFSNRYIDGSLVVARMKNLTFEVCPQKPADLVLDVQNIAARAALGFLFMVGDDLFLAAEMKSQRDSERVYFVNLKTGEGWADSSVGTAGRQPQINLIRDAAAMARWRIVETTGDKTPWVSYQVPEEKPAKAVA